MSTGFGRHFPWWLHRLLPIALILMMVSVAAPPRAYAAAAIYVDANTGSDSNDGATPTTAKQTIAAGVSAVDAGGSVFVAAGTYGGSVTINKSLTLQGAGIDQTILQGASKTGNGITLASGGNNVTIADLKITNYELGVSSANAGSSNITFEDVESSDNASAGFSFSGGVAISDITFRRVIANDNNDSGYGRGIMLQSMSKTNITVEDSTFLRNRISGIDLNDGPSSGGVPTSFAARGVRIVGNTVAGGTGVGEATDSGIAVTGYDSSGLYANIVSNNTITVYGRFGMEIKNAIGNGKTSGVGSFVVSGNTITMAGGPFNGTGANELRDLAGITVLERSDPSTDHRPTSGIAVISNTVSSISQTNSGSDSTGFGIVVGGLNQLVQNNIVTGNDVGIQLQQGHNQNQANLDDDYFGRDYSANTSAIISHNDLTGNAIPLRNVAVPAANSNFSCNWWGNVSGPGNASNPGGSGESFVGDGTFAPWLSFDSDTDTSAAGLQLPTTITVNPGADTSAAENDFRRLANAIGCVQSGQTVTLDGEFDWTAPNADADWVTGTDKTAGTADDSAILAPTNVNDVTVTATSLGSATVQGPGDKSAYNLEGFLNLFGSGTNQGWTISNLQIYDFDLALGFFCCETGATTSQFNNTTITNNHIRVATDLNTTVAPLDVNQNIGIHFAFGTNQTISNNQIDIPGDGVSDGTNLASSVGMQSNTSGGSVYDGLTIANNTVNVLNAQSATPEFIRGIWENGHAHTSSITVTDNLFTNLAAGNDPTLNNQQAFRVTSHSGNSSTVLYEQNTAEGAANGFVWLDTGTTQQPVIFRNNTLTDVLHGFRLGANGKALFEGNNASSISGGPGYGISVPATASAIFAATPDNNSLTGFGKGGYITGTLDLRNGTSIQGGAEGLLVVDSAAVTLDGVAFSGQTGNYITLENHADDLDGRTSTFEGALGKNLDATQYANVQSKLYDEHDDAALGLILLANPQLNVSTSSLSFEATTGASAPAGKSFTIANTRVAGGAFDWTLSTPSYDPAASGWLSCTPTSGSGLAIGATTTVTCQVDHSLLAPGYYTATLTLSSSTLDVENTPQTIEVTLAVAPLELSILPNHSTIEIDTNGALEVSISAVQSGDTTITLVSSNPAIASVPATATIPAGQLSISIPVTGEAAGGPVTITASLPDELGGDEASATVSVAAVGITITTPSTSLLIGSQSVVTVTLSRVQSSDTTITLGSSLPSVVAIQSSITLPANTTSIAVPITALAKGGPALINAALPEALGGGTTNIGISVRVPELTLTPTSTTVVVDEQTSLTVGISEVLGEDVIIQLQSSNTSVASVPATVTIPAGQLSISVPVTGEAVGGPVTITATLPTVWGADSTTAQITVIPGEYQHLLPFIWA